VQNSSSTFPRYPTPAAVAVNVGGMSPNVAISGAPPTMFTGTSARLLATVLGDDPYVTWTVNGIGGGSAQTGTVDAHGLYVAPSTAPPGGMVTIRATSGTGAFDEVTILVTDPPPPAPAPSLTAAANVGLETGPGGVVEGASKTFRGTRLAVIGDAVVVTTTPRRSGVVRVRVRDGERLLGRCLVKTVKGRSLDCRVPLAAGVRAEDVAVVMTFRVRGKLMEVRRFALGEAVGRHTHP
jgi:hypothetical protein